MHRHPSRRTLGPDYSGLGTKVVVSARTSNLTVGVAWDESSYGTL